MTHMLEITMKGQPLQRLRLAESGATTIGRASSGGLAIGGVAALENEQLLVEPVEAGVRVLVLPVASTLAQLRGATFEDGIVPFGEPLSLGELQLCFRKNVLERPSPVILGCLLATMGLLVLVGFADHPARDSRGLVVPDAPALQLHVAVCPDGPGAIHVRAREHEERAHAHAQRYPFDVASGIEAAQLFAVAAACYARTEDTVAAERNTGAHRAWAAQLQERYRALRIRLAVALDRHHPQVALTQLQDLMRMLEHQANHPYVRWLAAVGAQLSRSAT